MSLSFVLQTVIALYMVLAEGFHYKRKMAISLAARFMPRVRQGLAEQLEGLGKLLPVTHRDRQYWALAGITGGIAEEIRFRGFLPFYLSSLLPILPPLAAMLLAAALFGLAHWFQGWQGVWRNCASAGFLGVLVLSTRSLYPVILFHVLIELRPLATMWLLAPAKH